MLTRYEQRIFWQYLGNVLRVLPAGHPAISDVLKALLPMQPYSRNTECWGEIQQAARATHTVCSARLHHLVDGELRSIGRCRPSALRRRIGLLEKIFRLDALSTRIVELLYLNAALMPVNTLVKPLEDTIGHGAQVMSMMIGSSTIAMERRLAPDNLLRSTGMLWGGRNCREERLPRLVSSIERVLCEPLGTVADMQRALLGPPQKHDLAWADFVHLGDDREFVRRLVQGATRHREAGINLLLCGPPGTGKTEFCRTLAHRLGLTLYPVCEADHFGEDPTPSERLAGCLMAQQLLASSPSAILLFDEAEDLFPGTEIGALSGAIQIGNRQNTRSRVFIHRFLEGNAVPILWTCNNIRGISPAMLRRFSYVMEFFMPPRRARQRVWMRSLKEQGFGDCEAFARRCANMPLNPGIINQATRSARIAGGDGNAIERIAQQLGKVVGGRPLPPSAHNPTPFEPGLINCNEDILALTDRLVDLPECCYSLCIDGPPGTGKSAWVRYLAERMDMEVTLKRASDLLSMFVGGTEARIAKAFAEARQRNEFLVFDEADSFLQDRRSAHRSWEITGVNEMLTWMESHPLPFACTTNLMDAVDPAAMRRFTFKLRFDYMQPAQVREAFRLFFASNWPADIEIPDQLTPGDFAVVQRRARIQGIDCSSELARLLAEECRHKPGRPRPIGFRR